jgi:simple sugar transport system ATP-binding protein
MAGGQELAEISHELRGVDPGKVAAPRTVEHGGTPAPDNVPTVRA